MSQVFRVVSGWSNFEDHSTLEAAQAAADKMLPAGMKRNKRDPLYSPPYVITNEDGKWRVVYDPANYKTEGE